LKVFTEVITDIIIITEDSKLRATWLVQAFLLFVCCYRMTHFRLSYYCVCSAATDHLVQDYWYYCRVFHIPLLLDFDVVLNFIAVYNFSAIDIEGSCIIYDM
jgi:hypothetical protein